MRRFWRLTRLSLAIVAISTVSVPAAEPGNLAEGRRFVQTMCADCHAVGSKPAPSPVIAATPFTVVAQATRTTAMSLNAWLSGPHIDMPNLILSTSDRQNIIAYILSLKSQ